MEFVWKTAPDDRVRENHKFAALEKYCRCVNPPRITTPQRMTNAQAIDYVSNNDLW